MVASTLCCAHCQERFVFAGNSAKAFCPQCGSRAFTEVEAEVETLWFYARNGRKLGPVTAQLLHNMAAAGQILPADMVLQQGSSRWLPAGTVPDLFTGPALLTQQLTPEPRGRTLDVSEHDTQPESLNADHTVPPAAIPLGEPVSDSSGDLGFSVANQAASVRAAGPSDRTYASRPLRPANDTVAVPAPTLPEVPGYELLGELGRGGMGVVYKARQTGLQRLVALKMILAGAHAKSVDLIRFRMEAEAVAKLRHPHIVQIYEIGECKGVPYFSLEFVGGGTLADRIGTGPLHARAAAELAEKLARAMQAAHDHGILHRDLKPTNVLLESQVESAGALNPKITDFGLAKRLDDDTNQTKTGDIMGTPSYMAPEQAIGNVKALGPCTDIYALGAILYEMITGWPPFRGATVLDTLEQVRAQDPLPPRRFQPKVPRDLETVCLKCLEKEPRRRYTRAADLADDLQRFLAGQPVCARPVSLLERGLKLSRRRPALAALVTLTPLIAIIGLVAVLWQWRNAEVSRRDALVQAQAARAAEKLANQNAELAREQTRKAEAEHTKANLSAEQRRRDLYIAHMNVVQQAWERADLPQVLELLERQRPKAGQTDLRGFEWFYYWGMAHSSRHTFSGLGAAVRAAAYSPDGTTLALATGDGNVRLYRSDVPGQLKTAHKYDRPVTSIAFAPGGNRLAVGLGALNQPGEVHVWDLAKDDQQVLKGHQYPVFCVLFTPDGKSIVSGSADLKPGQGNPRFRQYLLFPGLKVAGEIKVWDASSGAEEGKFPADVGAVLSLAAAPDKDMLAVGSVDGLVQLWDRKEAKPLRVLPAGTRTPMWAVAFDRTGQKLAAGGGEWDRPADLRIWDLENRAPPLTLMGHSGGVLALTFAPRKERGSDTLVSAGLDRSVRLWDAGTGLELGSFRGHTGPVQALALGGDGRSLVSGGRDAVAQLWDIATPQEWLTLEAVMNPGGAHLIHSITFAPTGKRAATCGPVGVKVWNLETHRIEHELPNHLSPAFSGDGKLLAVSFLGGTRIVNLATGQVVRTIPSFPAHFLAFTPDGRYLAAANDKVKDAVVWDLNTGQEHARFSHDAGVRSLAVCVDNKTLATGDFAGLIKVWDIPSRKLLASNHFKGGTAPALAFSPDGKLLASGSDDACVRLWDLRLKEARVIKAHTEVIWGLAFAPDGQTLVSGSWDGQVKLWDVGSGEHRLTLKGPPRVVWSVAFAPDGRTVGAGYEDRVILWKAAATDK